MPCGSLALRLFGDSFLGRGPTTDLALGQIMIPGRAVVTAEEDDLQMPVVPRVFGKDGFQVLLGLDSVEDLMGHRREVLGLGWSKADLANELQNAVRMQRRHLLGCAALGEQRWCDLVDFLVGRLGRQRNSHRECVGVGVIKRNRDDRIELFEDLANLGRLLDPFHEAPSHAAPVEAAPVEATPVARQAR